MNVTTSTPTATNAEHPHWCVGGHHCTAAWRHDGEHISGLTGGSWVMTGPRPITMSRFKTMPGRGWSHAACLRAWPGWPRCAHLSEQSS
jgi:hypothetical protein